MGELHTEQLQAGVEREKRLVIVRPHPHARFSNPHARKRLAPELENRLRTVHLVTQLKSHGTQSAAA